MTDYIRALIADEHPALVYIMDPMCSWCWAFKPVLAEVRAALPQLGFYTLPGGLAPDSDEPMPIAQQKQIAATWQTIEDSVGTRFNHDFWRKCQPRRSTYPACRALLLARDEGMEDAMIEAIQQAYYLQAANPSDLDTLQGCAEVIGMDTAGFAQVINRPLLPSLRSKQPLKPVQPLNERLEQEIDFSRQLGVQSFPTLVLKRSDQWLALSHNYHSAEAIVEQIVPLIRP